MGNNQYVGRGSILMHVCFLLSTFHKVLSGNESWNDSFDYRPPITWDIFRLYKYEIIYDITQDLKLHYMLLMLWQIDVNRTIRLKLIRFVIPNFHEGIFFDVVVEKISFTMCHHVFLITGSEYLKFRSKYHAIRITTCNRRFS